jgi:hypothetical protein
VRRKVLGLSEGSSSKAGGSEGPRRDLFSLAVLCAFAPPTYYDSLVYHLALPLRYLQEGRIGFVPYNQYAHFPQNMEMIFRMVSLRGERYLRSTL